MQHGIFLSCPCVVTGAFSRADPSGAPPGIRNRAPIAAWYLSYTVSAASARARLVLCVRVDGTQGELAVDVVCRSSRGLPRPVRVLALRAPTVAGCRGDGAGRRLPCLSGSQVQVRIQRGRLQKVQPGAAGPVLPPPPPPHTHTHPTPPPPPSPLNIWVLLRSHLPPRHPQQSREHGADGGALCLRADAIDAPLLPSRGPGSAPRRSMQSHAMRAPPPRGLAMCVHAWRPWC